MKKRWHTVTRIRRASFWFGGAVDLLFVRANGQCTLIHHHLTLQRREASITEMEPFLCDVFYIQLWVFGDSVWCGTEWVPGMTTIIADDIYTPSTKIGWFLTICAPPPSWLSWRGSTLANGIYCRWMLVGGGLGWVKGGHCNRTTCKFNFRWCIITKCKLNPDYSWYLEWQKHKTYRRVSILVSHLYIFRIARFPSLSV